MSRWYDPVVGRFLQPDSIVPEPGNPQALNRYAYVQNNPLRYVDPTGHAPSDWLSFIGGLSNQVLTDLTFGLWEALAVPGHNMDRVTDDRYQEGRELGRSITEAVARVELATGMGMMAASTLAPPTMGAMAASAAESGGTTVVVGGVALTAEAVLVVDGIALSGLAIGQLMYMKRNQLPEREGGGRPGSNTEQNRQFRGAVREIERQLGRSLSKDEVRELHESLHSLEDPGYWDIVDEGLGMFGQGGD